jgi:hypothetical protein
MSGYPMAPIAAACNRFDGDARQSPAPSAVEAVIYIPLY